ncbi:C2H2-type zinc finger transcription factor, partial [Phycomyces blakesleeanus NRRL 1555(-)]
CNMGFSRSEHLNRHRRKHTGEKPYACTYRGCLRSFSRYDNMKQHLNTHKDNKSR